MNDNVTLSQEFNGIEELIDGGKVTVCVVGVGRIGLPTALSFADSGFRTIGVDIDERRIGKIRNGEYPLRDEPRYGEIFDRVTGSRRFSATTDIGEAVPDSRVILLSLPTPMDGDNVPDYSALRTVGRQLGDLVRPGSTIVVESTVEPGFVEDELVGLVEAGNRGIKDGHNVCVGACPETANPGEIMKDFGSLPRMVGATSGGALRIIERIYGRVFPVELVRMPDCKTANAVKLTTNVFRDVNIAFVNELALLFERLGIDTKTVLEAADRKYNFQAHRPGPGVGGPCLPVNSYQLLNSAAGAGEGLLRLVRAGRQVNESMPYHVVDLLRDALDERDMRLESSEVLILGVSYKPDVRDTQLSPAEAVVSELKRSGAGVRIFDPHFRGETVYGLEAYGDLDGAARDADAVVVVTAHREFRRIDPRHLASTMRSPVLVDASGVMDAQAARKAGLIFRGVGHAGTTA